MAKFQNLVGWVCFEFGITGSESVGRLRNDSETFLQINSNNSCFESGNVRIVASEVSFSTIANRHLQQSTGCHRTAITQIKIYMRSYQQPSNQIASLCHFEKVY